MRSLLRLPVAVSLISLSLLTSCSDEGDSGDSDEPTYQTFEVSSQDVSFELPADWDEFDLEKATEVASDPDNPFIDRLGMNAEQFKAMLESGMELFVTAPHAEGGFLNNLNVITFDAAMPTEAQLALQFRGMGATEVESDEIETAVGDGNSVDYVLEVNGVAVHGNALVLEADDAVLLITTSTKDADDTEEISEHILETLAED